MESKYDWDSVLVATLFITTATRHMRSLCCASAEPVVCGGSPNVLGVISGFLPVSSICIPLIHCQPPVVGGIGVAEGRETKYAGIVIRRGCAPVEAQDEIDELLFRVPEQADPTEAFNDIDAELDESAEAPKVAMIIASACAS
jgi:hypothetical protein